MLHKERPPKILGMVQSAENCTCVSELSEAREKNHLQILEGPCYNLDIECSLKFHVLKAWSSVWL